MDMSRREIRILFSWLFLFILWSCQNSEKKKFEEKTKLYSRTSKLIVGTEQYVTVYRNIYDSLNSWAENKLDAYRIATEPWKIDSLLCFNKQGDRLISSFQYQYTSEPTNHDGMILFYGIKMKNQWYFFHGPSIHLPREYYQKDTHTPLSFEKLHEIAMKEIFSGYLKKDKAGKWEINERFFDQVVPKSNEPVASGFGECFTCKSQEEYVMYIVRKNWQYRDTTKMAKPRPPS
jgi:hypothetical protein